ncbi:hypothetical protein IWQ60_007475 [Tieghemiomyces parasiticus]|uniref:Uncharacterized protein n=1 Tax=Tieghemiomyces parasiticus TaxID=78921 RepID=A0A9W7ZXB1_9FUNG|nr:hypothetical protein IWQ60_007475 [Tieghemiomyces parasiticus]
MLRLGPRWYPAPFRRAFTTAPSSPTARTLLSRSTAPLVTMLIYSSAVAYAYHTLFGFLLNEDIRSARAAELEGLRRTLADLEAQLPPSNPEGSLANSAPLSTS